jgi:uncharacterized membrane protein (UPF0127 family)
MRTSPESLVTLLSLAAAVLCVLPPVGCIRSTGNGDGGATSRATTGTRVSDASREYPLDSLATSTVTINGQVLRVWLAQESAPQAAGTTRSIVEEGLMFVPTVEIADDQGMLFVFPDERLRGFWMRNTIAPLDIAFARMNGTIVKIWQMPPLTLATFSSIEPAMFALEAKQGTFARLGIKEGDRMEIPASALTAP